MTTGEQHGLEALSFALDDLVNGDPGMQFNVADSAAGLLEELGRRLAGLGQRMLSWRVAPESLGWLALWSRTVAVADANRAAYQGGSSYGLQILWRAAFEIQYHLIVINDPRRIRWPEAAQDDGPESEMTPNDRLCAYVAYGLWNDARYFSVLMQGWLLRALWDDEGDEPLSGEQAAFRKLAQGVLGEDRAGNVGDSRDARNQNRWWANAQRMRVDAWLEHPRLARWAMVIRGINGGRGPGSYYGVLNPSRDSLGQDTFRTPLAIATPEYSRISSLYHGSTIAGFLVEKDGRVTPTLANAADLDREARANVYSLMMCWLLLHSLAVQVNEVAG